MWLYGEEKEYAKRIALNLRKLRRARRLSQRVVSEQLGFNHSLVSCVERGKRMATTITLLRLSRFYGVSIENLLEENYSAPTKKQTRFSI